MSRLADAQFVMRHDGFRSLTYVRRLRSREPYWSVLMQLRHGLGTVTGRTTTEALENARHVLEHDDRQRAEVSP